MFLLLLPAPALAACSPAACDSGYTDNGVTCSGNTCTRSCTRYACENWKDFGYESKSLPRVDDSYRHEATNSINIGTDTTKCYKVTGSGGGWISGDIVPDDYCENRGYGDCDAVVQTFFKGTSGHEWYNGMSGWTDGCYPSYKVLEIGFGGCGSSFNCAPADSAMGTRTIYVAPDSTLCNSIGWNNCDTDGYGESIRVAVTASWVEDTGTYRDSCEDDYDHYSPIENLDAGTIYLDIDEGDAVFRQSDKSCHFTYCGDGSCDANENCNTCSQDCGSCASCGDGSCNGGETQSSCCQDCGCPSGYSCSSNNCQPVCTPAGCDSGFSDSGVGCSGNSCTRSCYQYNCGQWSDFAFASHDLPKIDDSYRNEKTSGLKIGSDTTKCYRVTGSGGGSISGDIVPADYCEQMGYGDCDAVVQTFFKGYAGHEWYNGMSGWTDGCYPHTKVLEIGLNGCGSSFNCAPADSAMGTRTIYVAPDQSICNNIGWDKCDTDGYDELISVAVSANWVDDAGTYRQSCVNDRNHYSPITDLDGGTMYLDIDEGIAQNIYRNKVCSTGCGDGSCNGGETCYSCSQDCGGCCGNGVCESQFGESPQTCASDCISVPVCGDGSCDPGENCDQDDCCDGSVVDLNTDDDNCGYCDNSCGTDKTCIGGMCIYTGYCGDGYCSSTETKSSCFTDCASCTSGPCCDTSSGNYLPSTHVCDSTYGNWEYGCPWGTGTGNDAGKRIQKRYCAGDGAYCTGATAWGSWTVYDSCSSSEQCSSGVCIPDSTTPSCDVVNGASDKCSAECLCSAGEGDCDSDFDCEAGLICAEDVGSNYGFSSTVDICEVPFTGVPYDDPDYCLSRVCAEGEGDCDFDYECQSGLVCQYDFGEFYGFAGWVDVCEAIDRGCHQGAPGDVSYCTPACPCDLGEGPCYSDYYCETGLFCSDISSTGYGYPNGTKICDFLGGSTPIHKSMYTAELVPGVSGSSSLSATGNNINVAEIPIVGPFPVGNGIYIRGSAHFGSLSHPVSSKGDVTKNPCYVQGILDKDELLQKIPHFNVVITDRSSGAFHNEVFNMHILFTKKYGKACPVVYENRKYNFCAKVCRNPGDIIKNPPVPVDYPIPIPVSIIQKIIDGLGLTGPQPWGPFNDWNYPEPIPIVDTAIVAAGVLIVAKVIGNIISIFFLGTPIPG
jgi:hypothetical protein